MFLRKLTEEEINQIKKSKDAANKTIKVQRKKLAEKAKFYRSVRHELGELQLITGHPVIIKVEDRGICLNYDLLKKLERSLDKSDFGRSWVRIEEKYLSIRYEKQGQKGTMELIELPAYQVELLDGLPTIDLEA